MKKIEKKIVNTVLVYQAKDGAEFTTEQECEEYEKTFFCAVKATFMSLVKKTIVEEDLFSNGSDESLIHIVKIKSDDEIETVLKLISYTFLNREDFLNEQAEKLRTAKEDNGVVAILENYNHEFTYYGTEKELIDRITKSFSISE